MVCLDEGFADRIWTLTEFLILSKSNSLFGWDRKRISKILKGILDGIWGFQIPLTNLSLSSFKFKPHTPLTNPPNFHPHPQTTIPKPTIPYWLSTSWGCLSMSFTWVTVLGSCHSRGSILMVVVVVVLRVEIELETLFCWRLYWPRMWQQSSQWGLPWIWRWS